MKNDQVKKITGVAILMAIEIIFQVIGNMITFPGGISVNLSLIPVALGAILFGPLAGALLGLTNGVVVLFSASTQAIFMPYAPWGTIITCLLKCTIAGLVAGLIYKLIAKKNKLVAAIITSLLVPIINTGIFALCAFTIMIKAIEQLNEANVNVMTYVFIFMIGWNFIFELGVTAVLSPSIFKICKIKQEEN